MNYILKNENAIYYECDYSSDNSIFLKLGSSSYFITDSRYTIEAEKLVRDAEVITSSDIVLSANEIISKAKIKKIIVDPKEWDLLTYNKLISNLKIVFKQNPDFSHKKRVIKSDNEIKIIKKAVKLGEKAFKSLAKEINKNGFRENEYTLTYTAKSILSNFGKYSLSFDPIVAINANASKPHALPTNSKLKKNDLLLVDAGLKYKRYCSDRTRTVSTDKNFRFNIEQSFKSKKMQKVYDTVLKAHDVGISKARSGMKAKDIDLLTRDIIDKAGFGKYFVHSTGHGVGLDIHEMPYISSKSNTIIEDGMIYTIEPGIYIPDEFGVRIEDMVLMNSGKAEVL
ncbi:Aminopeptidase YpdF (MP-, MA-, MS-, AP-, NP-specific) [hydrothermal vent metagenome]|uniref:Aminopeptidase YpdF (MP-, MA-, MS-, AP-, NP-specific) n=1 Tax=hydrothermal vent metagenome TaxID=652676 RepID=A0A1W1BSI8_9ZZZZ